MKTTNVEKQGSNAPQTRASLDDQFEVFLASEQDLEPWPEPGDFWPDERPFGDDPDDDFHAAA